jgi:hypothetical protein
VISVTTASWTSASVVPMISGCGPKPLVGPLWCAHAVVRGVCVSQTHAKDSAVTKPMQRIVVTAKPGGPLRPLKDPRSVVEERGVR